MSERTVPRGLVILLLATSAVLLLSVVGLVGYWYGKQQVVTPPQTVAPKAKEPTPQKAADETANWKTYTNERYGFEFKYPKSYSEFAKDPGRIIFSGQPTDFVGGVGGATPLSLIIYSVEPQIQTYLKLHTPDDVIIDQKSFLRFYYDGEAAEGSHLYGQKIEAVHDNKTFWLVFEYASSGCLKPNEDENCEKNNNKLIEDSLKILDQILSTFKFLDQKSADETAGWQVYSHKVMYHPTFSFTFRYSKTATWEEVENWSAGQFVVKVKNPDFTVDVKSLEPNMAENYLGLEASEEVLLNSLPWKIFLAPKGYCDAGDCSPPFVVYQTIKNSYRFACIFSGTSQKSDSQSRIVSTFGFVE